MKSYQNVIKVHSFTTNLQQVNVFAAIQFLKNIKHVANRCMKIGKVFLCDPVS